MWWTTGKVLQLFIKKCNFLSFFWHFHNLLYLVYTVNFGGKRWVSSLCFCAVHGCGCYSKACPFRLNKNNDIHLSFKYTTIIKKLLDYFFGKPFLIIYGLFCLWTGCAVSYCKFLTFFYTLHTTKLLRRLYWLHSVRLSVCLACCVCSVTPAVLYVFFPYWAQMIAIMRGYVACNDLWPWSISSRSFNHNFAIKLLKYGTSCNDL